MATLSVDLHNNTVTPDEFVQNEIAFNLTGYQQNTVSPEEELININGASDRTLEFTLETSAVDTTNMEDFIIEDIDSNDDVSCEDIDDSESNTSCTSDEESNDGNKTSTNFAESRQYTKPNELYYGSELMLTKPTIVRILELGGIRRSKSKKNKADDMTNKNENKVKNKYRNEPIHATSRAIRFAEKYISTGSLPIQDGTIKDKRLEAAKDFDMNNEHFKKG